ncbi:MAG: hypothetical protein ABI680_05990 [Chthoniobacteraceae bacterium]
MEKLIPNLSMGGLVSRDEARADKYTPQPEGIWRFDVFTGRETRIRFEFFGCAPTLADFFDGVELDPARPIPARS